jgi:cation-transporting ATPase E
MTEAKKTKSKLATGMATALRKLILIIGIIVVPLGIGMLIMQTQAGAELTEAIRTTVGGLVGMIPNGLYMLVSVTLTVSVIRLAKKRTLIQDRNCVETLARVNILCVDKTGTITENNMEVKDIALMSPKNYDNNAINAIMLDYAGNMGAENETMQAIQTHFGNTARRRAQNIMPFSSAVKYGGMTFTQNETYLLGAPERILGTQYPKYRQKIDTYSKQGYRVLLLAQYSGTDITNTLEHNRIHPIALVMLSNKVREQAPAAFKYFAKHGVKIIVISGDNPVTVSHIATEAGIEGAEHYIDAAELKTDRQIKRAVNEYTVFGRVTPDQKRKLVRALKKAGHTVAMTGDGVNDVLALKESDCSIAMASGSEVTSQVADIVLLDSDFSVLPSVVMEGRRVINNIQRCATLYLSKNISAFLFSVIMVIAFGRQFPLTGSQYMPYELFLIGIPSYFIALQSGKNIIRGKFLANVMRGALPIGLTVFLLWSAIQYIPWLHYETNNGISTLPANISTMSNIMIALAGLLLLVKLSMPLTKTRAIMLTTTGLLYILAVIIFGNTIFHITPIHPQNILTTIALGVLCIIMVTALTITIEGKKSIRVK